MFFLRTNPVRIASSITLAAGLIVAMPTAMAQGTLIQSDTRAAAVNAAEPVTFDIPAQDLSAALIEFGRQSGQELLYSGADTDGIHTNGVFGTLSRPAAMGTLLTGTGLEFRTTANGGMLIADRAALDARLAQMEALRMRGIDALPSVEAASVGNGEAALIFGEGDSRYAGIEEVIVTGQKREERMQDVPIAISAFSMESLDAQKIEGGFDLLKSVPNVTFSKSNFTGYNFQVRGIGTQAISATTDPGVAISFNNTTLIVNRLFEQEYLDIERVEVLRGPQGTLYGRNATAGVVNVISAKPKFGESFGEVKVEVGNYSAQRYRGHINMPVMSRDDLAVRLAFAKTVRDGYGENLAASDRDIQNFIRDNSRAPIERNIDDRDLWTGRVSLSWAPTDRVTATAIYEIFQENDRRMRSTKQLCHYDDGDRLLAMSDGSTAYASDLVDARLNEVNKTRIYPHLLYGQLSQGCLPKSMFDMGDVAAGDRAGHGAYGTPNGNVIPYIRGGRSTVFLVGPGMYDSRNAPFPGNPGCQSAFLVSECVFDPLVTPGGQSRDLRDIFSLINPEYRARSELVDVSVDVDISDSLALTSQTVWARNDLYSTQDFLRFKTLPMFSDSSNAQLGSGTAPNLHVTPGGVFNDPQLGRSDRLLMQDVSQQASTQLSQELRLSSNFDGKMNFSVGANYTHFENTADYFVFINGLTALAQAGRIYSGPLSEHSTGGRGVWTGSESGTGVSAGCGIYYSPGTWIADGREYASCAYIQPDGIDEVVNNPQGHNFFLSRNPYKLSSAGLFGELYYSVTDLVKITAGLRLNWDRKVFTPTPSQTLLGDWRGRLTAGLFGSPQPNRDLGPGPYGYCHPNSPQRLYVGRLAGALPCATAGLAEYGMGYPTLPDIVQEWRVPTGRLGVDWKLDVDVSWIDEAMLYGFYTRGYKAGGANPPTQSAPSGLLLEAAQGASAPSVFRSEYVNAYEMGLKSRLLGGIATFNFSGFYYDYSDYQVSKIIDRTAVNENFDATIWGLEMEAMLALGTDTLFNAQVGYLRTRIADGERSLDLMDRTQGGYQHYVDPSWASVDCASNASHIACQDGERYRNGFDHWVTIRPSVIQASSCVAPSVLVSAEVMATGITEEVLAKFCPAGRLVSENHLPNGYDPITSAPNGGAGFLADIGGHELPSAPRFTFSAGLQHTLWLARNDWSVTARADWYWQDKSFNRVYNTEYDRLQSWSSTNISVWASNERLAVTVELYVKNIFDSSPITGAFLNSDDTGLSTNVFTLDPRLIGVSIRKSF